MNMLATSQTEISLPVVPMCARLTAAFLFFKSICRFVLQVVDRSPSHLCGVLVMNITTYFEATVTFQWEFGKGRNNFEKSHCGRMAVKPDEISYTSVGACWHNYSKGWWSECCKLFVARQRCATVCVVSCYLFVASQLYRIFKQVKTMQWS